MQEEKPSSNHNVTSISCQTLFKSCPAHKALEENKNYILKQTLNNLNHLSPSDQKQSPKKSAGGSHLRQLEKNSEDKTNSISSSRKSTLTHTDNWSQLHVANGKNIDSHKCDHLNCKKNPRTSFKVNSKCTTSEERLKNSKLTSSSIVDPCRQATQVIKETTSINRLSSSSFNNGCVSSLDNNSTSMKDWKIHLHSHEIRKLKRELDQSNEKVTTLTSQLATHSHMVAAFEQSLASMSVRLQQLTNLSSEKDCEIARLKNEVQELRSVDHNVIITSNNSSTSKKSKEKNNSESKHTFITHSVSVCSMKDQLTEQEKRKSLLVRRHTFVSPVINDLERVNETQATKEKRWFKAFRRSHSSKKNSSTATSSVHKTEEASSVLSSGYRVTSMESLLHLDLIHDSHATLMNELEIQLKEKENTITDLRLQALTSAHQLQSLEEVQIALKQKIAEYKKENDRLRLSSVKSTASASINSVKDPEEYSHSTSYEPSSPSPQVETKSNDKLNDGSIFN